VGLPAAVGEQGLRLDAANLKASHRLTEAARDFKQLLRVVVEAGRLNNCLAEL
jgi:hypothetical protein